MFYWGILLQRIGSIFDALIQRTDGCTEVLWLLVQTHHIIRCSHKRYKNRHFNKHMIFRYWEEGLGEPEQTCRLPRAFAASTRDLDIYYIVQWLCLRKCAPEYSLLAWITHKSPFKATQEILYSDEGLGKPVQMCRFARAFAARTKVLSIAIWVTTWEFWTVTKAQTRPSKCAEKVLRPIWKIGENTLKVRTGLALGRLW